MAVTSDPKVWKIMFGIFAILTVVFAILFYFRDIFITFVAGFVLILITENVYQDYDTKMKDKPRWQRKLYGGALLIFWIITAYILLSSQIGQVAVLVSDATENPELGRSLYTQYETYIPKINGEPIITRSHIESIIDYIFGFISSFLSSLSFFVLNGILIIPLMFYMYFKRKDKVNKFTTCYLPKKYCKSFNAAVRDIGKELYDYFNAKLTESIVVGSISCLGFYIAGVKGWLFLGVIAGFLNIVPYIGPIIGGIPAILVGYLEGPTVALYALITVLVAQLVDNLYLIPFMISGKVRIDPLLSIVLILVFAKLFGVFGMVFAIPIYSVYKIVLRESYKELVKMK